MIVLDWDYHPYLLRYPHPYPADRVRLNGTDRSADCQKRNPAAIAERVWNDSEDGDMAGQKSRTKMWLLGLVFLCSLSMAEVQAKSTRPIEMDLSSTRLIPAGYHLGSYQTMRISRSAGKIRYDRPVSPARRHLAKATRGISCVPYARLVSGIAIGGNAWEWWENAVGRYARGNHPEVGAVLNFRSNPRMRLGHVAVVSQIKNPREITIDHANWPSAGIPGSIAHNIAVVDVSEANDWSAVRVELGRGGNFGAVYPTYGFIYDRPDNGTIEAMTHAPAPPSELNPAPRDLRPAAEQPWRSYEEVAEAFAGSSHRAEFSLSPSVKPYLPR